MKNSSCFVFVLVLSLLAGNSYAHFTAKGHMHTLSETKQVFLNPDCAETDTCDLKRFALTTSVYEVWFSDDPNYPTYSNGVIMEYETDAVDALEKYAIVQFVKGCVFYSSKNSEGKINTNVSDIVPSFGENIPLCFPQWVIDSQDTDPVYNSNPEYGRFYLLRWNKPGSYNGRTQKFYGTEKPKNPVVYMADYPSGAFLTATGAKNAALEFKTCIYRARDVPVKTRRDEIHFANPLNCFEWQNVYVYDFGKARFEANWKNVPRLADVPAQAERSVRVKMYLLVVFVTQFIVCAVATLFLILLLVWGTGLVAYIVLWICMPAADELSSV